MDYKDKLSMRIGCFAGLSLTYQEVEGIIKVMDIEELINETERAFQQLKNCIDDYWKTESECSEETKLLMLINGWHSPFEACNELVKRIGTNETTLRNICKKCGTGFKEIGYAKIAREAEKILKSEMSRQPTDCKKEVGI